MTLTQEKKVSLCRLATVPFALAQVKTQIDALVKNNYDVTLVTSSEDGWLEKKKNPLGVSDKVTYKHVEIRRSIHLISDIKALFKLFKYFRARKFQIVHSITPKAGLLTAIAGYFAGVPVRMHTYTGQVWVNRSGPVRGLLKWTDRLIARLSTRVYADGKNQAKFLIEQGIVSEEKIEVIGEGSVAGIDVERFDRNRMLPRRKVIRDRLKISEGEFVIGFLGRITMDKGIAELIDAFTKLQRLDAEVSLVLIGPREPDCDKMPPGILNEIENNPRIHEIGFTLDVESYLIASDIISLPSYREGFSGVLLQAACLGLPAVGSDIYGINDCIVDKQTGLLVSVKNSDQLFQAFRALYENKSVVEEMSRNAQKRVKKYYSSEWFNNAIVAEYEKAIQSKKQSV